VIQRVSPLARGGMRLTKQIRKRYWDIALSRRNEVCVKSKDGHILYSPSKNISARNTYLHGVKDPRVFQWMANHIGEGMTVIDVGANIGAYTLRLAKLVGANGNVIAIEPTSSNLFFLHRNVEENGFSNVSIEAVALGAVDGEIEMSVAALNAGEHHVASPEDGAASREIVEMVRLDDIVKKHGAPILSFVKIDVEGFEHDVLLGFAETLRAQTPILLIEHSQEAQGRYGRRREETIAFLQSLGYQAFSLRKQGMGPYAWANGGGDAFWSKTTLADSSAK
jgi:FkbM family methyltransferase